MAGLPLTALAICLFIPAGESQFTIHVEHSQINVTVGENALISMRPSVEVSGGNWVFDGKAVAQWTGDSVFYVSGYQSRAEVFTTNGSLLLRSVNNSDSGEYRVTMFLKSGSSASATVTLWAIEPVSKPVITSNDTNPVEYNDTVSLTCTARGTDVSYLWFMNNKTVSAGGRITLTSNNSTLTISAVLRSDEEFTCEAYNLVNRNTSDPFLLNVRYGPENLTISITPDLAAYGTGSNVNFSCSAVSNPAPAFQWYFNGSSLQTSGQRLILVDLSVNDTGSYTCEAFNNVTKRSSSTTRNLVVLEPVSNVTVTRNNLSPVEINDTVVLICDAQGTIQRRTWLKDNQPIQENDRIFTTSDKANLTITRVKRTDTGTFNCTVSNDYNSGSTAIYVQVNYGPDNVRIVPQGPFVADIGLPLTLTCSAQSVPSGEYKWYNATNHLQTGQQYTIQTVSSVDSGNYTCEVYNNVTMKRSNLTVEVTAREKTATAPRGLSGGAIAGIVIGSVAGVCLVAAAVAWFVKTQGSRLKAGSDKGYPKMTSPSNIQPSQTEYAAVERKQPNQPKPEPSSNGANQAPPQAKDRDIIYTNPKIINAAAKPTSEVEVDKTDYATLKYQ